MKKFILKTMFVSVMSIAAIEGVSGDVSEAIWIDKSEINKVCKENGGKIDNGECKANKLDAENICKNVQGRLGTEDEFIRREREKMEILSSETRPDTIAEAVKRTLETSIIYWVAGEIYTEYDYNFNDDAVNDDDYMTLIPGSAHKVAPSLGCNDRIEIVVEGKHSLEKHSNCMGVGEDPTSLYSVNCVEK